jgi:hypothetical protein
MKHFFFVLVGMTSHFHSLLARAYELTLKDGTGFSLLPKPLKI